MTAGVASGGTPASASCSSIVQSSATNLLALLEEDEPALQAAALKRLLPATQLFWADIADSLGTIEALAETQSFPERHLAAAVASRVYFHLEEYSDALRLALQSGKYFDVKDNSQYTQKILTEGVTTYLRLRLSEWEGDGPGDANTASSSSADLKTGYLQKSSQLEPWMDPLFEVAMMRKETMEALGIALEARRLDKLEEILVKQPNQSQNLNWIMTSCPTVIESKAFRQEVLRVVIKMYNQLPEVKGKFSELPNVCRALYLLDDVDAVANMLKGLCDAGDTDKRLMAYQLAFDLAEHENQQFAASLLAAFPDPPPYEEVPPKKEEGEAAAATSSPDGESVAQEESIPLISGDPFTTPTPASAMPQATGGDSVTTGPVPAKEQRPPPDSTESYPDRAYRTVRYILTGRAAIDFQLQFLSQRNHGDVTLIEHVKNVVDQRDAILHNAVVISHGIMHAGTTESVFLSKNLEWLGKAVSWAQFTATASLGVIHKGHLANSRDVLATYLPQGATTGGGYSEGGALYALGMIHANHSDPSVRGYLLEQLKASSQNEPIQHGACLGLGLLCMGSQDSEVYEELKGILFTDSAIGGEAASWAIGMVMLGSGSEDVATELISYAHDTQHEKIVRGCAVALALLSFKREEEAETLISELLADKDPILRYGAAFAIGMAYCGVYAHSAARRLLHLSVSDVSDDVRRAAVTAIGFVLCQHPDFVPKVVALLAESYNPHVRYGACMAVGIACAWGAQKDATNLLLPMTNDATDFVRQGALMALGLVMQQSTNSMNDQTTEIRDLMMKTITDDHEELMARFGAIIGCGLIDAGGRNSASTFWSKNGSLRAETAVGFLMFCQLWYWHPLMHMVSLTFQATACIGLTDTLQIPSSFTAKSTIPVSSFAYPPEFKEKKSDAPTKVSSAVLSTAARKAQSKRKAAESKADTDATMTDAKAESKDATEGAASKTNGETSTDKDGKPTDSAAASIPPPSDTLNNPFRVIRRQDNFIEITKDQRYSPLVRNKVKGIAMLKDSTPGEPEEFVEANSNKKKKEPEAPQTFEYTG